MSHPQATQFDNKASGSKWSHHPYSLKFCFTVYDDNHAAMFSESPLAAPCDASCGPDTASEYSEHDLSLVKMPAPQQLVHAPLHGFVEFYPFPANFRAVPAPPSVHAALKPIFIGQIPLGITEECLCWVFQYFTGKHVFGIEFIQKQSQRQDRRGCVHAMCLEEDWPVIATLHERLLYDESGVWVAEGAEQKHHLRTHCDSRRGGAAQNLPRHPMGVEAARSKFHERRAAYNAGMRIPYAVAAPIALL